MKKMIRNALSIVLVLALAFTMAGCGSGGQGDAGTETKNENEASQEGTGAGSDSGAEEKAPTIMMVGRKRSLRGRQNCKCGRYGLSWRGQSFCD